MYRVLDCTTLRGSHDDEIDHTIKFSHSPSNTIEIWEWYGLVPFLSILSLHHTVRPQYCVPLFFENSMACLSASALIQLSTETVAAICLNNWKKTAFTIEGYYIMTWIELWNMFFNCGKLTLCCIHGYGIVVHYMLWRNTMAPHQFIFVKLIPCAKLFYFLGYTVISQLRSSCESHPFQW